MMKHLEITQVEFILCSNKMPGSPFCSASVFGHFYLLSVSLTMSTARLDVSGSHPGGFFLNNINQLVSNRYLCHMWERCLWSQPSVPGHGEAVSHKLFHLLLLWWVKRTFSETSASGAFKIHLDGFGIDGAKMKELKKKKSMVPKSNAISLFFFICICTES